MAQYLFTSSAEKLGGVFQLDSATGKTKQLLEGSYRGLTEGPDGAFYVVSGTRNRQDVPLTDHRAVIYRIDPANGKTERIAEHLVGDAHDLRWADGNFYLVASLGNQIIRLDAECQALDRMQIVEDDRDICHVNCLVASGGALYCSVFTLSPGDRKEKRLTGVWQKDGKVLRVDYPNRRFETVCAPLGQPHSLVPRNGSLYLTESFRSRVARIDLASGEMQVMAGYPGWVRGLCFGPNEALVGSCRKMRRDRKRFAPFGMVRKWLEDLNPFSGILVVDPDTWKVRSRISIPDGEVYEIHAVRS